MQRTRRHGTVILGAVLLVLGLALSCPRPLLAQIPSGYVQTTATVPPLANGSFGAAWTNLSPSSQLGLLGCVSTFQTTVNGQIDSSGHFSTLLADVAQICPSPSTWTFTFTFACPNAAPTGSFQVAVPVTGGGSTEDITAQVTAAIPPNPCGGASGGQVLYPGAATSAIPRVISTIPSTKLGNSAISDNGISVSSTEPITAPQFNGSGAGITGLVPLQIGPGTFQNGAYIFPGSLTASQINTAINSQAFCTVIGVLDQSCIANAAAVASPGQQIYVPAGTYTGTVSIISQSGVSLLLDPGAIINYPLIIQGAGFARANTVTISAGLAQGSTTIPGNFAAFSPGNTVLIEQTGSGGPNNQTGLEFATVSSASGTQLVLTTGTRFQYYTSFTVSVVASAAKYTGTVANNSISIPGNYTSFLSSGSLVRIENTTGTDSSQGSTAYFEIAKVASITTSAVTFESVLHASYTNPWLAKMSVVSSINVIGNGGYIQDFTVKNADTVNVSNLSVGTSNLMLDYNVQVDSLYGNAAQAYPASLYFTFDFHGNVRGLTSKGSLSSTDNGNVKFLGVQDFAISGVSTWYGTATAEGTYPFMIDDIYTPYDIWNANDDVNAVTAGSPNGGVVNYGIYLSGMRNSNAGQLSTTAGVHLIESTGLKISGLHTPAVLNIESGSDYNIELFSADSMYLGNTAGVTNSKFSHFTFSSGTTGANARTVFLASGSSGNVFDHGNFAASGNTTFYFNTASDSNNTLEKIVDAASTTSITSNGNSQTLIQNTFAGSISGTFAGPTFNAPIQGSFTSTGYFYSTYNLSSSGFPSSGTSIALSGLGRNGSGGSNEADWFSGAIPGSGLTPSHACYVNSGSGYKAACLFDAQGDSLIINHINQTASGNFAKTCTMSSGTTCTFTISVAYSSSPIGIASPQGATYTGGMASCAASGTTVTITAPTSNSLTWGCVLIGNPN